MKLSSDLNFFFFGQHNASVGEQIETYETKSIKNIILSRLWTKG